MGGLRVSLFCDGIIRQRKEKVYYKSKNFFFKSVTLWTLITIVIYERRNLSEAFAESRLAECRISDKYHAESDKCYLTVF